MKAIVLNQNASLVYADMPKPQRTPRRDVLIRVTAAGVCGSDIHRGFESGAYHYPLVMGHEFAGSIEEAPDIQAGTRVTAFPLIPCRTCRFCRVGEFARCIDYDYVGSRSDGAFAEHVTVPRENVFLLPDHVDTLHAAMTEPCAVALHGVRRLRLETGHVGVVFGGGPIGAMTAQWLRIGGCREVVVVEVDEQKEQTLSTLAFTVVNPRRHEPVETIRAMTDGYGADVVVEACGLPLTFTQAIRCAAASGQVLFMGNINGDFTLAKEDFSSILRRELTILGTWNSKIVPPGRDDWTTVLAYLDREMQVAPLITHTPPLADGARVLERMAAREERFGKVVFVEGGR